MVRGTEAIKEQTTAQDDLYRQADESYRTPLERLARAYELDPDKRRDLLQEIHLQLWRSFALFDGRCSLKTWVYRVAHHTATSHVIRNRRIYSNPVGLEDLDVAATFNAEGGHWPVKGSGAPVETVSKPKAVRQASDRALSGRDRCRFNWRDNPKNGSWKP